MDGRLRRLSDLAVQCESLVELEPEVKAKAMRNNLQHLQDALSQFKMDTLQKQEQLKEALKESERRSKELKEYQSSVENLQKWIEVTKMAASLPVAMVTTDQETVQRVSRI